LFQAIENHVTPEQTSNTLQKIVDRLKESIQVNEYEPELKSEIFIFCKGQKVQVVAKTKRQNCNASGNLRVNHAKRMQTFNCMVMCYRWLT